MRSRLSTAVVLITGCALALAAAANDTRDLVLRLDVEIHRATQAVLAGHPGSQQAARALVDRVDATGVVTRYIAGEADEPRASRAALRGPLHNLRLALDQPAIASRVLTRAAPQSGPMLAWDAKEGATCERPIPLSPGSALRVEVPAEGSRWFVVAPSRDESARFAISTLGSEIDAAVDVFADCREDDLPALASGDDNFGLQAIAALPSASHPVVVRLRNKGNAGIASIDAVLAVTISGRITRSDTGAPIASKTVVAFQGSSPSVSNFAGQASSQADGTYQLDIFGGGATNTYVRTRPIFEFESLDEAWDNVPCADSFALSSCGPGTPSAVATSDPALVANINFALSPGATILGQVVDRSGAPVPFANVSAIEVGAPQSQQRNTNTDEFGRYRITALRNGQYRIVATANGYRSQVFRDQDCIDDCGSVAGDLLTAVEFGVSRADFNLSRSGSIRVNVTAEGQPLNAFGSVSALNAAGSVVSTIFVNPGQTSVVLGPLQQGTYRVRAEENGLVSEYYDEVQCLQTCGSAEFQAATPIAVSNDSAPIEISMDLARLPEQSGVVRDTEGEPIANATVKLVRAFTQLSTTTDSNGAYRLRPSGAGLHRIQAGAPSHIDEAHANVPCDLNANACPGATLVDLSAGTSSAPVDFELARSATIRGSVSGLGSSTFFNVYALNTSNDPLNLGQFLNTGEGNFELRDLPPGTFHFGYSGGNNGRLQLFRDIDCGAQAFSFPQCPTSAATPVTLASESVVEGVNFTQRSRSGRPGRVTDAATGGGIAGVIIDAFDPQTGQRTRSVATDAEGRFEQGPDFNSVTWLLATDNYIGYLNEVYNDIECASGSVYLGNCSLAGATPVTFPGDESEIVISLNRENILFASGFE